MTGRKVRAFASQDTPTETLQKMIPWEVVAFYVAALAILSAVVAEDAALVQAVAWIVFAVGLVGTPLYMIATWGESRGFAAKIPQLLIAMVAFSVWAFALGGPFKELWFWREWIGGIALLIGTLLLTTISRLLPNHG